MNRAFETLPYLVDPEEMVGLHEDGTEAGNLRRWFSLGPSARRKEADGKARQGEVEIVSGGFVENLLGESGRKFGSRGFRSPKDDIESWREGWSDEVGV